MSPRAVLAGILLLAVALRFCFLDRHSVWSDEMFAVWLSRFSWHDLFLVVKTIDFHPPLYYALMKAWIGLAGTSEAALRAPSAVFSVVGVWLTYALARRVTSERVALLGALLLATAPFHIMAGQEARMYPLLGALALGATLSLVYAVERAGAIRWGLYSVLSALMVYTAYLGVLVIAAHAAWILGWERRRLGWWLVAMGAAACLCAPWVPSLWAQISQARAYDQLLAVQELPRSAYGAARIGDLLALFAFGGSLYGTAGYFSASGLGPLERVAVLLPFLVLIGFGLASLRADRWRPALLGLLLVVPIAAVGGVSLARPVFLPRWFSFLVPFWAMLVALGIVHLARSVRRHPARFAAGCALGVLLYALPVLHRHYLEPSTWSFRWRDAAAAAARQGTTPNDLFLYVDTPAEQTFEYYFRAPHASLTLGPPGTAGAASMTPAQLLRLAGYRHVWLVVNGPVTSGVRQTLVPALNTTFRLSALYDFVGATLLRFDARGTSRP